MFKEYEASIARCLDRNRECLQAKDYLCVAQTHDERKRDAAR